LEEANPKHEIRNKLKIPNPKQCALSNLRRWNPIGARILAAKGYPAVATASAAVSASLGYEDGEKIRRSTLIDLMGRIARSVDVPVTADLEAGYGDSLSELEVTVELVALRRGALRSAAPGRGWCRPPEADAVVAAR
jgi:2-methylisocitrate lyase-like PEP mutase family enzyme